MDTTGRLEAIWLSCRPLPQLLCRVIKVQNAPRMARKALLKQAPQPSSAITAPDHLRCTDDALAERFESIRWNRPEGVAFTLVA
jgi:hypothetical protein